MYKYGYRDLRRRDIIIMCYDLLKQGVLRIRDADGKLEWKDPSMSWDGPWHHTVQKGNLNCILWSKIMFNVVFKKAPQSMRNGKVWVPSGCQSCWKVVARPKTIKQLFAMVDLQKALDLDAKCGLEHRAHVFGLYGGYWYTRSMEQGLQVYKIVRQALDENTLLGPDVDLILKRGCTEMEMEAGPSNEYELTQGQMEIEALVHSCFNIDVVKYQQSRMAIDYVHSRWIEYAYQWGDETVYEFLDPDYPMYKPLVTYHHMLEDDNGEKRSSTDQTDDRQGGS